MEGFHSMYMPLINVISCNNPKVECASFLVTWLGTTILCVLLLYNEGAKTNICVFED